MSLFDRDPAPGAMVHTQAPPEALVVALHDYGDHGAEVRPVIESWMKHVPRTYFIAPDAPVSLSDHSDRRAWYGQADADAAPPDGALDLAAAALEHMLLARLRRINLSPGRLVLAGFGQGAVVALHLALVRAQLDCAGILACSATPLPSIDVPPRARGVKVRLIRARQVGMPPEHSLGGMIRELMAQGVDARGSLLESGAPHEAIRLGASYLSELVAAAHRAPLG
ncbi:MAG: phospholipase/Carboxylesterase [Rhodospirillales bacterium]|jgi:predicted esterase|nr:phospholipase/Carboxylesterase [Rhodospirillales bacterium]